MAKLPDSHSAKTHASLAFLLLAAALSTFPPVTTDIYLPALPQLTASLRGTTAQGQQTLAFYFLGLSIGQLFYGPWSDRIGRRPTMLIGVAVFLAASLGCAVASSMQAMIGLRFCQGLGACAGLVTSSAIVRDRYDHQQSARIFSLLLLSRGLGPLLAPLAGGVIVTFVGWRAIFWALAAFGALLGAWVLFGFKESRTAEVAARARSESPWKAYGSALRNPRIVGYVCTNGLNFACMFAWIAAAPYLIIAGYGVPALYFGWIFGINAVGFMTASQINRRLLRTIAADRMMIGGATTAAGAFISHQTALAMAAVIFACALGALVFPVRLLLRPR